MTETEYLTSIGPNYIVVNDPKTSPNEIARQNSISFFNHLKEKEEAFTAFKIGVNGKKEVMAKTNKYIKEVRNILH